MYTNKFFLDSEGNIILNGMFLVDLNCKFLTYQVRIKNKTLILHTGACYSILTQTRANSLKILTNVNIDILGYGHNLFKSN